MKTVILTVPQHATVEQIEQFLRYAPGSPTAPKPAPRIVGAVFPAGWA